MWPGRRWLGLLLAALVALQSSPAAGHAFPERSEPRVGATLSTAPEQVRIWFDGELEPRFSQVHVLDGSGRAVDRGDPRVDPQNRRLLHVTLPPLAAGRYTVRWSVLAIDGHRTEGDYAFTVRGAP
jgi:copper resistance protein C